MHAVRCNPAVDLFNREQQGLHSHLYVNWLSVESKGMIYEESVL